MVSFADERLVSILRHRNFLKELQDIAVEGEVLTDFSLWRGIQGNPIRKLHHL